MSRESSRAALRAGLVESIEAKQAEVRRLTEQLRMALLEEAYEMRHTRKPTWGSAGRPRCRRCREYLITGEPVIEYVDDEGRVVDVVHEKCRGYR